MKFYPRIPQKLEVYFQAELEQYRQALALNDLHKAWNHLERAHIIGQRYLYEHSYVHWKMLLFGIKVKSAKEVIGQIPRLLVGGVKSFVGKIPVGNPGGANVPGLQPFPIAEDIQHIFHEAGVI